MLLNEMAENIQPSIGLFNFYEAKLNEIKTLKEDENTFILRTLREFCNFVGVHLEVNRCIRCSSNILKTISFKHNGMLCNHCSRELFVKPEDIRFSKLINHLFNNQYDQMNQYYDMFPYAIKCISKYIFDTAGIKLQTLKSY
ncbi:MAG: DNA repair protein RecO C-terminal domain-containing protein [Mycoplasmoidaceae bacterium]|nr:DNA repair protein RecO C-terminal domain-containing protein [Mycoplasmoidaceae bacterium]